MRPHIRGHVRNGPWWPPGKRDHMMTSSNRNIFRVTGPLWGEFTGQRWICLTKTSPAELSGFVCLNNGWVNNRDASDLRRHYDVTVMNNYRYWKEWNYGEISIKLGLRWKPVSEMSSIASESFRETRLSIHCWPYPTGHQNIRRNDTSQ